jgi:hypothetical protein
MPSIFHYIVELSKKPTVVVVSSMLSSAGEEAEEDLCSPILSKARLKGIVPKLAYR